MVAAIVGGQQPIGMLGVAHDGIEVDDGVEMAGCANPLIDGLAIGLAERAGMIVVRSNIGRDGGPVDAQAMCVGASNDLLVGGEDALDERGVFAGGTSPLRASPPRSLTPSKTMSPADACGSQHVAIEAGESIGSEAIGEQMIAADALIGYADIARLGEPAGARRAHRSSGRCRWWLRRDRR